jgi:hypothetical protein
MNRVVPHRLDSGAGWRRLVTATLAVPAVALAVGSGIVDLQPARRGDSVALHDASGRRGTLTLTNLNPAVNAWLVLTLAPPNGEPLVAHLENASPATQRIALDAALPGRLNITSTDSSGARAPAHRRATGCTTRFACCRPRRCCRCW